MSRFLWEHIKIFFSQVTLLHTYFSVVDNLKKLINLGWAIILKPSSISKIMPYFLLSIFFNFYKLAFKIDLQKFDSMSENTPILH